MSEPEGWVCTECGAATHGDTCMSCGNTRPIRSPGPPYAGTYGRIYGLPIDSLAARCMLILPVLFGLGLLYLLVTEAASCFR